MSRFFWLAQIGLRHDAPAAESGWTFCGAARVADPSPLIAAVVPRPRRPIRAHGGPHGGGDWIARIASALNMIQAEICTIAPVYRGSEADRLPVGSRLPARTGAARCQRSGTIPQRPTGPNPVRSTIYHPSVKVVGLALLLRLPCGRTSRMFNQMAKLPSLDADLKPMTRVEIVRSEGVATRIMTEMGAPSHHAVVARRLASARRNAPVPTSSPQVVPARLRLPERGSRSRQRRRGRRS